MATITITDDPAFTGPAGVNLVYTAATSDERVADVALTGDTETFTNEWWDRLGAIDANGAPADGRGGHGLLQEGGRSWFHCRGGHSRERSSQTPTPTGRGLPQPLTP